MPQHRMTLMRKWLLKDHVDSILTVPDTDDTIFCQDVDAFTLPRRATSSASCFVPGNTWCTMISTGSADWSAYHFIKFWLTFASDEIARDRCAFDFAVGIRSVT